MNEIGDRMAAAPTTISLRTLVFDLKMTNGQLLSLLENENVQVPKRCLKYLIPQEKPAADS